MENTNDNQKIQEVINKLDNKSRNACPNCGSEECEVRNYDMIWHDGDVHCTKCGTYVRHFDAG